MKSLRYFIDNRRRCKDIDYAWELLNAYCKALQHGDLNACQKCDNSLISVRKRIDEFITKYCL